MSCTCGYGIRGSAECLGNRSDCAVKAPCLGGAFLVDVKCDFRRQGGAAGGLCSVCGKEPREHADWIVERVKVHTTIVGHVMRQVFQQDVNIQSGDSLEVVGDEAIVRRRP